MEAKKKLLTYAGLKALEEELENLKVVKRKEVAAKIKEAREQGDLSENAEYDAAKDEQRDIEARIEELEAILKNAEVVVEDEVDLQTVVKLYLEKAGYEVICFEKGNDAINYIGNKVDAWILDIMLGDDVNGYDVIKAIREKYPDVPVLFTSARDQDLDRILGLELGSDDYITKPYSSKELVLRVNNLIKRAYKQTESHILEIASYQVDLDRRVVSKKDKEIKLTTLEFDLLVLLSKNINKSFSREEILESVWGDDYFGSDRAVDDLVRRLRKKCKDLNILTVYGYGYRLSL